MSLISAAERLAAIDHFAVTLDQSRCLHTLDKFAGCDACFELCPVGAIQPGKPPSLNEEACVNCLACLPACPLGAYAAKDAVPALLKCAAHVKARVIELVCESHPNPELDLPGSEATIRLRGCLAGLGAGAYLALIALGLERIIARTDACAQCPWSSLQSRVEVQVGQAQRLLEPWGRSGSVICAAPASVDGLLERPVWDADNPPLSRRALFRLASQQGRLATAHALTEDAAPANRQLSRERLRVLGAVTHLPARKLGRDTPSMAGLGFADISVSADCTACGTCARACPTQALQFEKKGQHYWLKFKAQVCIGCELCGHVCAPGAITIDQAPLFDQIYGQNEPLILREGELVRCEGCHALMAARQGVRLCPVCEFRRNNPFGSTVPPGFGPLRGGEN
jgi:Fe-S-cluster-containing hydrogenase component 2